MTSSKRQQSLFESDEPATSPEDNSASQPPGERAAEQPPTDPSDLTDKTVFVVDAHSLIYQVFHAMEDMTSPKGEAIGAVHGFIRDMVDTIEKHAPDYLICAFDAPGDTFRHEKYSDYKVDRDPMPDDLRPQIPKILALLSAMGIPAIELAGFEADDLLATVAEQAETKGARCYLVTNDKDCRQLISDQTSLYLIRKGEFFAADELMSAWGVRPEQVVDFQALVGDPIDNVPGVPLIGPKLAKTLLDEYGTLDNVLDHAEEVSGKKRRENLINGKATALLSRELVRLDRFAPLEVDWEASLVGGANSEQLDALCQEFGFRRLGERLATLADGREPSQVIKEPWKADYQLVCDLDSLEQLCQEMAKQESLSVDTETTHTLPRFAEIVGYSFSWAEGMGYYVPVRAPAGDVCLDAVTVRDLVKPILENESIRKVGQNLKYDMIVLRSVGIELQGVYIDTMVADYLLAPGERSHNMDDLAKRYLDHDTISIKELIGTGKKQKRMDEVPVEQVAEYAAEDADVPLRLAQILGPKLIEQGLERLYFDVEIPLLNVLVEMEWNGIRVDSARLESMSEQFARQIEELETTIYAMAGKTFNIDSGQQLANVLFEDLQLPVVKRTKSRPSTDVEVLTELAKSHELPAKIIEYRQAAKLKSTYIDALPQLIHPETGRVHTSFKQDVAATGRLSSKDPNLQNIPIRTEQGRAIRSAFRAGPDDWKLLTADYSQIELRVLAHFSQDEALQTAFANDVDIHQLVASQVYQVPLDEVSREMRRAAKAINFGIIYGQTPFGLAKALDISKDDAADFIEAYFQQYPGVGQFMTDVLDQCHQERSVSTIMGRRREVSGVKAADRRSKYRSLPERIAINTVIQGSAADLIKIAMINTFARLQREELQAKLLLQIHDELVFESPPDEIEVLGNLVVQEMTNAYPLKVPLKVDVNVGDNWAECK